LTFFLDSDVNNSLFKFVQVFLETTFTTLPLISAVILLNGQ
jgi:hypothetical protein